MSHRYLFACLAGWMVGLFGSDPCWASDPALLDEVVVSARRIPGLSLDLSRFPGAVTVVTAEDITRSGATTVQEVITRTPGASFSDQQGFGLASDATVNLRGVINSSRSNLLVLVDGVRQNRITGDDVHWQAIPVHHIERIEIIRGGGATIFGEGALTGVINIITKPESARLLETKTGVEVGSFGWQQYYANAAGRAKAVEYAASVSRQLIDGYREFSWSRNSTVTSHLGVEIAPALHVKTKVLHSEDTTAFPGLLTLAQAQQRQQQTNAFHGINTNETDQVSLDLITGPTQGLSSALTLFWTRRLQTSEDSINFNAFTITPSRGLHARLGHEWSGTTLSNTLIGGVELSQDKATTGDPGVGQDSESNRGAYGLYLDNTLTIADRLSLAGGLRFDKSRYEESLTFPAFEGTLRFEGWNPKLGARLQVIPKTLELFASYARPFKAPNVDDFSSRLGSSFSGNADLQPQQADTYEVGVSASHGPIQTDATLFYIRIDDEILFNQVAGSNQNFDTRRVGVEASAHMQSREQPVRGEVAYTFVDAEFREGTFVQKTIPGTPEHTLMSSVGVSPLPGCWIDLQWQLVHDFFRINDLNNTLGGADNYGVLNLVVQYDWPRPSWGGARWPEFRTYLKIANLTNEEYVTYQSSNGTNLNGAGEAPMPPMTFTGGVTVRF